MNRTQLRKTIKRRHRTLDITKQTL
ncbi:hypothetical protein NC652_041669 [Populus alba x Populus x berolinensis]|nr:hypothetical protein NC652_041669 [Populus alba x Populus x berolinensis]